MKTAFVSVCANVCVHLENKCRRGQDNFPHILGKESLRAEKLYAKFLPEASFYDQIKNLWDLRVDNGNTNTALTMAALAGTAIILGKLSLPTI